MHPVNGSMRLRAKVHSVGFIPGGPGGTPPSRVDGHEIHCLPRTVSVAGRFGVGRGARVAHPRHTLASAWEFGSARAHATDPPKVCMSLSRLE